MTSMAQALPEAGRIAGIDYGTVRIGVAVTDPDRVLASPYENYTRRNAKLDEDYFKRLAAEARIVGFVVGLPVHTSGEESQKSFEARQFGSWLHEITELPVVYFDERYTSSQAERFMIDAKMTRDKRKKRLDMLAAQIMLEAFIESGCRGQSEPGAIDD